MNEDSSANEKSKIEELKKSLYSRNAPDVRGHRHVRLHQKNFDIKSDWEHPEENADEEDFNQNYTSHSGSFFGKLLIGSVIFFVVALSIGAYLVLKGSNIVSANNIDINLAGPISVAGGDPTTFKVQVTNKNNVALQVVDVDVEFPSGTADPNDTRHELKSFQQTIPDIGPGTMGEQPVSAVLYGQENTKKTISVLVNYRVTGSNATFTKQKDFDILINSSPITLSINSYKEINSNQTLAFDVSVISNSKQVVKNLLLSANYPFGYTFSSSDPNPVNSLNSVWNIGDLPPGGKRVVHVSGTVVGQDGDVRVFTYKVGVGDSANAKSVSTEYISGVQQVTINKPFLSLSLTLDGNAVDTNYVGTFDQPIHAQISWVNNLPSSIINGEVHLKLSGTAYDKSSVKPDSGFYDSANNEIVWNKITTPELGTVDAGGTGSVSFSLTPRDSSTPNRAVINPFIALTISGQANRISEANVPEAISSSVKKNITISSNVALSGVILHSIGPFSNTGPIPPHAEQQTTYNAVWTVYNTSSSIDGVQVVATLPPYVKWMGATSPSSENITYDPVSGQVTWNIGNVPAYVGSGSDKRSVTFQIGLNAGVDLVGQTPVLVGNSVLTARDDFTGKPLTNTVQGMTTRFSTDPAFVDGNEIIQK